MDNVKVLLGVFNQEKALRYCENRWIVCSSSSPDWAVGSVGR